MKILFYGINFAPEKIGIGKYSGEMVDWLLERGNEIEVITTMPFYPEWKVEEKYIKQWFVKEKKNNLTIKRCKIYVPNKVSSIKRIAHELSFFFMSFKFWLPTFFRSYDIIICVAPPMLIGVFPSIYKFFRNTKVIYHIQDLQIDAAKDLKMIKSQALLSVLELIERRIMENVSVVSSISEGMKLKIFSKVKDVDKKYFMLPNWVNTEFIKPIENSDRLRKLFKFDRSDFIVLYSGNLGEKQGLESLIDAAEILQKQNANHIKILICGDGAIKGKLMELKSEKKIENVIFHNLLPYEDLPQLMSLADIHLILQKKAAADSVMPSKLTTILSAGGLVIVSSGHETTLAKTVLNNKIGICIEPENTTLLVETILNIYEDKDCFSEYKNNARKYAVENLNINNILLNFEQKIKGEL